MNCSICNTPIDDKNNCSAQPLIDGRCCFACDDLIVTPVRIARATSSCRIDLQIEIALNSYRAAKRLRELIVWPQ